MKKIIMTLFYAGILTGSMYALYTTVPPMWAGFLAAQRQQAISEFITKTNPPSPYAQCFKEQGDAVVRLEAPPPKDKNNVDEWDKTLSALRVNEQILRFKLSAEKTGLFKGVDGEIVINVPALMCVTNICNQCGMK